MTVDSGQLRRFGANPNLGGLGSRSPLQNAAGKPTLPHRGRSSFQVWPDDLPSDHRSGGLSPQRAPNNTPPNRWSRLGAPGRDATTCRACATPPRPSPPKRTNGARPTLHSVWQSHVGESRSRMGVSSRAIDGPGPHHTMMCCHLHPPRKARNFQLRAEWNQGYGLLGARLLGEVQADCDQENKWPHKRSRPRHVCDCGNSQETGHFEVPGPARLSQPDPSRSAMPAKRLVVSIRTLRPLLETSWSLSVRSRGDVHND